MVEKSNLSMTPSAEFSNVNAYDLLIQLSKLCKGRVKVPPSIALQLFSVVLRVIRSQGHVKMCNRSNYTTK
ncbi:unnamed protein product [Peronospora farinosa]|uniref:Uncharacterized protein n=1 Tax=Peronospora farinosa TaxID=134698 RepID=A0ABN8C3W8_9STRA|nr:unnamed protein product [Peronospora farinosa]